MYMSKEMNHVKELRDKLMLNQQEFADLMAVDVATVSRWERGVQKPKAVHLRRMARLRKKEG
ncbi:hypothetical protein LCGC14_1035210 [marine sediment metagenome]|uniref:HTH cro/C1-type domain-containing protein n=1 Tax=marine sediment metagenome TaxID=412755 RepID=A0A0F9NF20_9ZZZZ